MNINLVHKCLGLCSDYYMKSLILAYYKDNRHVALLAKNSELSLQLAIGASTICSPGLEMVD